MRVLSRKCIFYFKFKLFSNILNLNFFNELYLKIILTVIPQDWTRNFIIPLQKYKFKNNYVSNKIN
jgi:hypothetical protein